MDDEREKPAWLLGCWRLQKAEPGVELMAGVVMEFSADGLLRYRIPLEGREHCFDLSYSVCGDVLQTRHIEGGQQQRVRFTRDDAGRLELNFNGARAWFAREGRI